MQFMEVRSQEFVPRVQNRFNGWNHKNWKTKMLSSLLGYERSLLHGLSFVLLFLHMISNGKFNTTRNLFYQQRGNLG